MVMDCLWFTSPSRYINTNSLPTYQAGALPTRPPGRVIYTHMIVIVFVVSSLFWQFSLSIWIMPCGFMIHTCITRRDAYPCSGKSAPPIAPLIYIHTVPLSIWEKFDKDYMLNSLCYNLQGLCMRCQCHEPLRRLPGYLLLDVRTVSKRGWREFLVFYCSWPQKAITVSSARSGRDWRCLDARCAWGTRHA